MLNMKMKLKKAKKNNKKIKIYNNRTWWQNCK